MAGADVAIANVAPTVVVSTFAAAVPEGSGFTLAARVRPTRSSPSVSWCPC